MSNICVPQAIFLVSSKCFWQHLDKDKNTGSDCSVWLKESGKQVFYCAQILIWGIVFVINRVTFKQHKIHVTSTVVLKYFSVFHSRHSYYYRLLSSVYKDSLCKHYKFLSSSNKFWQNAKDSGDVTDIQKMTHVRNR